MSSSSIPLVFLPGMMCDARLFSPQIAHFSARHGVQVYPLGLHNNMTALAEFVLENTPEQFALVGLSMGGLVAMEIMRIAPERVERLALLDTNPLAELPEVTAKRDPQIKRVLNGELRAVMRDEMKPNYLSDGPNQGTILDLCMAMAERLGPTVFERQSQAIQSRRDQQDTLRNVSVPTLIVCGEDDTLCPIERHQLMHKLVPGSQLEIIQCAGHLPTLEQPEATIQALEAWLTPQIS